MSCPLTPEQFRALGRLDTCTVANAIETLDARLRNEGFADASVHSFVHLVSLDGPVEVGGLQVRPGYLVHGDRHGVLAIPNELAAEIPAVAARILEKERRLIGLCRVPDFSLAKLRQAVKDRT